MLHVYVCRECVLNKLNLLDIGIVSTCGMFYFSPYL